MLVCVDRDAARKHLIARYPKLDGEFNPALVHAVATSDFREEWRSVAVRWRQGSMELAEPASAQDLEAALVLLADVRDALDLDERCLIDAARDRGMTWPQIAGALNLKSAQGAQQRRKRLREGFNPVDPARRTGNAPQPGAE